MSFSLLFLDELKGFYKSKVMIFLLIFVPIIALLFYFIYPGALIEKIIIASVIVSSIGGVLSAAMLSANIINERDTNTYDLFLIRPIKRWNILLSKYLAVVICVSLACMLALVINILAYMVESSALPDFLITHIIDNVILTFSLIAIGSSFGVLMGVILSSLVAAVIIDIFIGQYLMYIPVLLGQFTNDPNLMTAIFGIILMIGLLAIAILLFNKKEF
jgi:ABC-type transport system involved in multi-copper enzyme maturation permease subunit